MFIGNILVESGVPCIQHHWLTDSNEVRPMIDDIDGLRRRIEQCLRLAQSVTDRMTSEALVAYARELESLETFLASLNAQMI